jgi:hypothetical protein
MTVRSARDSMRAAGLQWRLTERVKYEYKLITLRDGGAGTQREADLRELNELGARGWHVVDVRSDSGSENGKTRNVLLQLDLHINVPRG